MESSVDISTVNKDSGENNDLNNLNNIFNNITNRSAEKLQSNLIHFTTLIQTIVIIDQLHEEARYQTF